MIDHEAIEARLAADAYYRRTWTDRALARVRSALTAAGVPALLAENRELRSYKPCAPCLATDHENCTGDCPSMCCALAAEETENRRLREVALEVVHATSPIVGTRENTLAEWERFHKATHALWLALGRPEEPSDGR